MSDVRTPQDTPDVAAAELALGVLDGEERAGALRRVLAEPGFAREVEAWRTYFGELFASWPDVIAPAGVFERVERSLDAPQGVAASRGRFWPALAGLTSIAAAGLLVFVVARPPQAPTPAPAPVETPAVRPLLVASIAPTAKGAAIAAVFDPARGLLRVSQGAAPARGRSAELWVIGADKTPHSLGLLKTGGATSVTPTAAIRSQLAGGATLAVTIEPAGGSPTGAPTGPIVLKGDLSEV